MVVKKTFYSMDIKNPYCSKGNLLWKHNDDSRLGKKFQRELGIVKKQVEDKAIAQKEQDIRDELNYQRAMRKIKGLKREYGAK